MWARGPIRHCPAQGQGKRRTNVGAGRCSRVDGNDDAPLVAEGKRRRSVVDLDLAVGVRVVVRVQAEEARRLRRACKQSKVVDSERSQPAISPMAIQPQLVARAERYSVGEGERTSAT